MFVTRKYVITTEKFNGDKDLRIIQLSDLHNTVHGKGQSGLIDAVKDEKPDLIVMTGDIVEPGRSFRPVEILLYGIRDAAPVYYITGNHEYYAKGVNKTEKIWAKLREFGVNVMLDGFTRLSVKGMDVVLCAADDPKRKNYDPGYDCREAFEHAFTGLSDLSGYKILLTHRPERINEYRKYPFDLVLSGHAHGGQVRIPFLINGLFAPNQGLFPKYAGGPYTHGGLTHIVSRGLSVYPKIPRIFNPPELVSVTISSSKGATIRWTD